MFFSRGTEGELTKAEGLISTRGIHEVSNFCKLRPDEKYYSWVTQLAVAMMNIFEKTELHLGLSPNFFDTRTDSYLGPRPNLGDHIPFREIR